MITLFDDIVISLGRFLAAFLGHHIGKGFVSVPLIVFHHYLNFSVELGVSFVNIQVLNSCLGNSVDSPMDNPALLFDDVRHMVETELVAFEYYPGYGH